MKKKICFLPLVLLFCQALLTAQISGPTRSESGFHMPNTTMQQSARDSLFIWQEKVLLELNDNLVETRATIFFKAHVLTGPEQKRLSIGDVLKVELLDESGKLLKNQYHKIVDGVVEGSFEVPKNTVPGHYYLRAYTRWMLNYGPDNFAIQKLVIGTPREMRSTPLGSTENISFFPEGGALIAGLENRVVIATSQILPDGAFIVDVDGEVVSTVKKYGNDIATAIFTPKRRNSYFLSLKNGEKYELPEIQDAGLTLRSNNIGDQNSHIRVDATQGLVDDDLYLKGQLNGTTYFETALDFASKPQVEIEIPKDKIPQGTLMLTVVDELDQIWAKRPIQIKDDALHISISPIDGQDLSENEKLYQVRVTDFEGQPVETELSIGVNFKQDKKLFRAESTDGLIDKNNLRSRRFINDLRVLIGEAFYTQSKMPYSSLPAEIYYDFQSGLSFYGQAYDLDKMLLPNTKIQVLISTKNDAVAREVITNDDGIFELTDLQIDGKAGMVFRTVADETREKMVKVIPFEYEVPPLAPTNSTNKEGLELQSAASIGSKRKNSVKPIAKTQNDLIVLDGVTLRAKKEFKDYSRPSVYGIEPNRVVHQDMAYPKTIPQLLLGIPGVQVIGLGDIEPRVVLPKAASAGPLLWVLDGLPLVQPTSLLGIISLISYIDVERIEFLFGPRAAIYGTRAAGGAFLIYTRTGGYDDYFNRKDAQLNYEGFHESIDFETYHNGLSARAKERNKVLYWNPSLKTDENGEALVRLNTPKSAVKLEIKTTAITPEGRIAKSTELFDLR